MAESDQISNGPQAKPWLVWLGLLVPLVLIVTAAGGYVLFSGTDEEHEEEPVPAVVTHGKDYYVFIRTLELYPKQRGGKSWDSDGSAPDIQYTLSWQDNIVFESKVVEDSLIGTWDAVTLDLKSAVLQGEIDLSGSIAAATVRIEKDTKIQVVIRDDDLIDDDQIGTFHIQAGQLTLGDNEFTIFRAADPDMLKRVVVRVIDKSLPLTELIEEAMRP